MPWPSSALLATLLLPCSNALDLQPASAIGGLTKSRPLKGRFLHITGKVPRSLSHALHEYLQNVDISKHVDFHPDPHFKTYSSTESNAACHRKHGPAGYYGAETSACDSPYALVNATLDWIKHNVADHIDFVVWTGDSARHDNDEKLPRSQEEVISQNEFMVQKMTEVFGSGEVHEDPTKAFKIPVVPTFGNNDIMPHNILLRGPNKWTVKYTDLWRGFIPEAQRHQFQQGGWFSVEVIPGKLAVLSLNTLYVYWKPGDKTFTNPWNSYFFSSNSGVDGCAKKKEPGYEQFEWLRIQLQIMRDRGMSAILIGHVPPARTNSKESWEETCWQKYTLWERQYRDVIVASLFGHMNIDHFMLQDYHHVKKGTKKGLMKASNISAEHAAPPRGLLTDGEVTVASASDYLIDLRSRWSKLPSPPSKGTKKRLSLAKYINKEGGDDEYGDEFQDEDEEEAENEPSLSFWQKIISIQAKPQKTPKDRTKKSFLHKIGGPYAERYSVSLVSPSVVPNYLPTIRIFEYNITGLENFADSPILTRETSGESLDRFSTDLDEDLPDQDQDFSDFSDDTTYLRKIKSILKRRHKRNKKDSLKKSKKYKFKVPKGPSKSSPPGPAYSPQTLTFTGYTQYFANLTHINNDFVEETQTLNDGSPRTIFGLQIGEDGSIEQMRWKEGKHGKHQGKKPRPKPHPKKFKFEIEYNTKTDEIYRLKDLTVRSYVDLARRIGKGDKEKGSQSYDVEKGNDGSEEVDLEGGKKRGKRKHHKRSKNKAWLTFVDRAFVGTLDPRELELFAAPVVQDVENVENEDNNEDEEEEVMEL